MTINALEKAFKTKTEHLEFSHDKETTADF